MTSFEGNPDIDPTGPVYEFSREFSNTDSTTLLRDHAFNRHSMQDGKHISPFDNGKIQIGTDGIKVKMLQGLNVADFRRVAAAATRATIGVDLSTEDRWEHCQVFCDWFKASNSGVWEYSTRKYAEGSGLYCETHEQHRYNPEDPDLTVSHYRGLVSDDADSNEMLKGGLQTALESQVLVFEVSGVSRTCTHQLVRTRNAAFHQQSQRASFYGNQPEVRMPESVWLNERARNAFIQAKIASDVAYQVACEEDISYQDARFVMLEGTDNYIMLEYSLRELINVYAYRGCSMFSWEIVYVMREIRRQVVEAYPFLADSLKISCQKTGSKCSACDGTGKVMGNFLVDEEETSQPASQKTEWRPITCPDCQGMGKTGMKCTFQGWEEVEGQCDFPYAKRANRTFISDGHAIKRRPGLIHAPRPEGPPHIHPEWQNIGSTNDGPTYVAPAGTEAPVSYEQSLVVGIDHAGEGAVVVMDVTDPEKPVIIRPDADRDKHGFKKVARRHMQEGS